MPFIIYTYIDMYISLQAYVIAPESPFEDLPRARNAAGAQLRPVTARVPEVDAAAEAHGRSLVNDVSSHLEA